MAKIRQSDKPKRLLAEIGVANARFALQSPGGAPHSVAVCRAEDHRSLRSAIKGYLARLDPHRVVRDAAFGVSAPRVGDEIEFSDNPWSFSVESTRRALGFRRLEVVSKTAAVALSVPQLDPGDWRKIGRGKRDSDAPAALLAPGNSLGTSCLVPTPAGPLALETEGGHVTLPPFSDYEAGVLGFLRPKFDHISAERILSGPGLVNLYMALAPIEGRPAQRLEAATIVRRAATGECPVCLDVIDMFSDILGTVAADLVLSLGARGGLYIAGDLVPKMGETFNVRRFRRRFEDKGRLTQYLAAIPTYVITRDSPAFLGLAQLLDRQSIH
jgi:glucokinase